jgi:hypothetical protein
MSQSVIGALRVNLGLDAAQFDRGARQAQSTAQRLGRQLQGIGAAISAVGVGITLAIRGQINAADDLAKAADRIGVPVEALSQLQHAASLSGVEMGTLQTAMQRLSRQMVESAGDFTAIGISVRDANGVMRPTVDVLQDLADRIAAMPEGAERTALAMQFFGRSGAELIPMLRGGSAGIRSMMEEADRLGLTLSENTARAAEQFNDNLSRLGAVVTGITRQITAALVPVLATVTDALVAVAGQFARLSPEMQTFAAGIAGITVVVGPALIAIGTLARSLTLLGAAATIALGPWGVLAAVVAAAAVAFVAFRRDAEPAQGTIESVQTAQEQLNAAMGTFAATGAPQAGAAAIAYARNLEQQARAALAAAEAEIALMEAELARFQSAPMEERGLLGDLEEGAMARNIAASRGEIDGLRDSLRQAQDAVSDLRLVQVAAEATTATPAVAALTVETDDLEDAIARVGGAAGRAAAVQVPDFGESLRGLGEIAAESGAQIRSSFESAFVNFVSGASSARDAIRSLLQDLARLAAQSAFRSLMSRFEGGGGLFSSIFGGFRAEGGPVSTGRAYVVGERGPEMFVPKSAGTIIPNGAASGRIELVVHAAEGVTIEQVGQIAAGVSVRVMQSGQAQQRRGLSSSLTSLDLRGA